MTAIRTINMRMQHFFLLFFCCISASTIFSLAPSTFSWAFSISYPIMSIILPCYDTRLACSWWIAYTFCMCCSTLPSSFLRLIRILCSMSKSMSTCCYWAMCSTDYRDGPTCRVRSWLCLFLLGRLLRKESLSSAFITDFSIRLSLICLYLFSCFSYSLRVYFSLFFCGGSLNKLSISSIIFLVCSISLSIMLFSSRIYCAIAESSYWAHWSWY